MTNEQQPRSPQAIADDLERLSADIDEALGRLTSAVAALRAQAQPREVTDAEVEAARGQLEGNEPTFRIRAALQAAEQARHKT